MFPTTYNLAEVLEGYETLKRLATSRNHIVPGHDPAVMKIYPAASPQLAGSGHPPRRRSEGVSGRIATRYSLILRSGEGECVSKDGSHVRAYCPSFETATRAPQDEVREYTAARPTPFRQTHSRDAPPNPARSSRTPRDRSRAHRRKSPRPPCRPRSAPRDRRENDRRRSRSPGTRSSADRARPRAQRRAIAGREQIRLAARAAVPHRPDRVDDVFRRQVVAARDLRRAGGAAAERSAFRQQLPSGGAVDRAIDPAAAEQRGVGGVDDGVDRERGDVGDHDFELRRPNFGGKQRSEHCGNLAITPRLTRRSRPRLLSTGTKTERSGRRT